MQVGEIASIDDLATYITEATEKENTQHVMMALAIASILTYLVFYTDMAETVAQQIGGVTSSLLSNIPSASKVADVTGGITR